MTLVAVFLLFFVGGPIMFRALTKAPPSRNGMRLLGVSAGVFAIAGLALRYGTPERWGQDVLVSVAGILLIWFAWVCVLAFGAQALRRADPGKRMRRWSGVIGALGTTVPWFGLASANMVGF